MRAARWCTLVATFTLAAGLVAGGAPAPASGAARISSVDFPDPDVVAAGGTYWGYATGSHGINIQVLSLADLLAGRAPHEGLPALPSWAVPGKTWAPGVVQLRSGFVMYYTVHDAQSGFQCISVATSASAAGPFVDRSTAPFVCQLSDGGSIDASPFLAPDGGAYLVWKSDDNSRGFSPTLWSQALGPDGLTLVGAPVRLLSDAAAWQFPVIERPVMTALDGAYYLFYAGNLWNTRRSGIGYAVCRSPLGPCTEGSPDRAWLTTGGDVVGPSGPAPFRSPGGGSFFAFAAWSGPIGYANGGIRTLWAGTLSFAPGYRLTGRDGGVFTFGTAGYLGSASTARPVAPIVAMARTATGDGYWQAGADGGVFAYGTAPFEGSTGALRLVAPVVGIMPASDDRGYALVARDGGVFTFGTFAFAGAGVGRPGAPVVGGAMSRFLDGPGYWLARADGTVDAFGAAPPLGSGHGAVVGIAADPTGIGYWLVAADGTVEAFGSAHAFGSLAPTAHAPVVALVPTPTGAGYWLVASDGGVFTFGDAAFGGSLGGAPLAAPITGATSAPAPLQCGC